MKNSMVITLLFSFSTAFAGPASLVQDIACTEADSNFRSTCIAKSVSGNLYAHFRNDKYLTENSYTKIVRQKDANGVLSYQVEFVTNSQRSDVGVEKVLLLSVSQDPEFASEGSIVTVQGTNMDGTELKWVMKVLKR